MINITVIGCHMGATHFVTFILGPSPVLQEVKNAQILS